DMLGGGSPEEKKQASKIDQEKSRLLFTGADVKQIVFRTAPNIVVAEGRRTLKEADFKRATKMMTAEKEEDLAAPTAKNNSQQA
ncbi:507_t:CDS:2, partial [Funneliformis geosporum]